MLNNNVIPYVENCKYLGIVIHLQSDLYDIERQVRKFYANTNMLLRTFLAPPAERQRSFSNTDLSVVRLSVRPFVKIEGGGGGLSQKHFSNFSSFLA